MLDEMRVGLAGVGATGAEVARRLTRRPDVTIVAAADRGPDKVGCDLADLIGGLTRRAVRVSEDVASLGDARPDLVVLTVGSEIGSVMPALETLLKGGTNTISLCEELAYPWRSHPAEAERIDELARDNGVTVLATGCNPGFLLDTFPIIVSSALQSVERIEIRRTAQLTPFGPLLKKFGLGLTPEQHRAAAGDPVVGHVGFEQSLTHIAGVLRWDLDTVEVDHPAPLIVAAEKRRGAHLEVRPGTVAAVQQRARAIRDGEAVIQVEGHFGFFEAGDEVERGDSWQFTGAGRKVTLRSDTGFDSWETTIAELLNLMAPTVAAPPGLLVTSDLPVNAFAAKD